MHKATLFVGIAVVTLVATLAGIWSGALPALLVGTVSAGLLAYVCWKSCHQPAPGNPT